ncbi:MAG: hypothetical protein ACLFVJ_18445 [Persicimonas sp.]
MTSTNQLDELIWSGDALASIVDDPTRTLRVRNWALRRLRLTISADEVAQIAAGLLTDDDPSLAASAFVTIDKLDRTVDAQRLRAFCRRESTPQWLALGAAGLLAAQGDEDAQEEMFSAPINHSRWRSWARRDPEGFARSATEHIDEHSDDPAFLYACIETGLPGLARPLVELAGRNDDGEQRADLFARMLSRSGTYRAWLQKGSRISWEHDDLPVSSSIVARDAVDRQLETLNEHAQKGDWEAFADCALTLVDAYREAIASIDSHVLRWAMALVDTLVDEPDLVQEPIERAEIALSLWHAVDSVGHIEAELADESRADESRLEVSLGGLPFVIGAERERLIEVLEAGWSGSPRQEAQVSQWLDEFDDLDLWLEALEIASRLDGFDLWEWTVEAVEITEDPELDYDEEWIADNLQLIWARQPKAIRARPELIFGSRSSICNAAIGALGEQTERWASSLLLEHLDLISTHGDPELLWSTLADLGDPAGLDAMLDAWRPGELSLAYDIGLLAGICGRADELPQGVVEDIERMDEREERIRTRAMEVADSGGDLLDFFASQSARLLELRCAECDKAYEYEFDTIYFDFLGQTGTDSAVDSLFFDRVVVCKNCGARDRYTFTKQAHRALSMMIEVVVGAAEAHGEMPEDAPLVGWHPELWDGSSFDRPQQALDRLRRQADKQSDRPEAWRRLGYWSTRFYADEQAKEAFERADKLDHAGVPDPRELRDRGIPVAPVTPSEAKELIADHTRRLGSSVRNTMKKAMKVRRYAMHECLINGNWRDGRDLCQVLVSRKMPGQKLAVATFLIDLWCLGIKDTIFTTGMTSDRYRDLKQRLGQTGDALEPAPPELIARVVDQALRYALALGFFPPPDYFAASKLIGDIDPEASQESIPLGDDGQPFYMAGPHDDVDAIGDQLSRRVSPYGFGFVVGQPW